MPSLSQPRIGRHIARAQAKRLVDVSLGFLGATGKDLAKSDEGMRVGEIAIQRQRMLAFGDALDGALRQDLDVAEKRMAAGVVRERRQSSGQLRFGGREGRAGIGHKEFPPSAMSAAADPTSASTLSGSAASARSKKLRACAIWFGVLPRWTQDKP